MNAKVENIGTGKTSDAGLLILAAAVLVAGVAAYYLAPQLASLWRGVIVVGAIVVACAIAWFTTPGRAVREYVRETQFEMRKVVWPTREETLRTTLVVILVTVVIAIVLGLIDLFLKWAILDHLLKM